MSSPGFFYSAEEQAQAQALARRQAFAQALMQQSAESPGTGQYGGLRSAGNAILGAYLAKKGDQQAQDFARQTQGRYASDLANLLKGTSSTPAQSPQISNSAGMPQSQQLDPEGNVMAPGQGTPGYQAAPQQQQAPSAFTDRLIASGNPALMQQFAPKIIENQFNRENTMWERGLPMTEAAREQAQLQSDLAQRNAEFTNKLPMTAAQAAANRLQAAQLGETSRHNRVEEDVARNPFGIGGGTMGQNLPTGEDFLKTLPPGLAAQIKAVGTYRQPAPAGRTSPTGIKFMSLVNQAFPSFDASQYGSKVKARNDFATGKNGNTVRSLNVAVQHLDQLGQLSDAMANGNVQAVNKIANFFASQTGAPAPTNFNAARQLVGDEIVKAIVGAGGGVSDREEAAHNISSASSPAQLAGVIKTYQGLLSGQLVGLRQQYQKSTGLDDFEDFLAPETRAKLEAHGAASGAASPPPRTSTANITPEQAAAELARRRAAKGGK